tara:strand:+ start:1559 stop:1837 length:279 start_codon:yes stop_codon:yes gene_type:complete
MAYKMKGSPMQRNFGISPVKGKFIDALKSGKFKEAGKVLKKEGKAIKAALFAEGGDGKSKGFFRHSDSRFERADPRGAYYEEKRRQRKEKDK